MCSLSPPRSSRQTHLKTGIESLYENLGGTVRLVGILPDGTPATTSTGGAGSSVGYSSGSVEADHSVERAVSQDGSHVIFQAPSDAAEPYEAGQGGMTEVYDRIDGTETIEISKPALGATPAVTTPQPATFQTPSVDGSRVFFTTSAELTTPSNTGVANNSEDLYEYDLETHMTDLTVNVNPADAASGAMVQGVIDSSTDGSYVYFVAKGQFVSGEGVDGQPNVYVVHNGAKPTFIATLGSEGECRYLADPCVWSPYPAIREAYVTPNDGTWRSCPADESADRQLP